MVSGEKVWDPLCAGLLQQSLSVPCTAVRLTPFCNLTCSTSEDSELHQSQWLSPTSSLLPTVAALGTLYPTRISTCLLVPSHSPDNFCAAAKTTGKYNLSFDPEGASLWPEPDEEEGGGVQKEMKGKSRQGSRGDAMMDDQLEDIADGPKNAKITLSFPLSAAPLPATLTSPNHCRGSPSSSSPSPHRRRPSSSGSKGSDEGSLWKLDATMDVKHRSFKPPRHDSSPSSSPSSSSSPLTVSSLIRKDIKSPPPLKCSKVSLETQFSRFPPRSPSGSMGSCHSGDGRDERHRLANGTASPSQTAQILFNLGAVTYQGQRSGDTERKEKLTGRPSAKVGSPHRPNIHPPTLHLPPPLPPPPAATEALVAPTHSSSFSPANSPKPELICGVCHRLFSSASSLTVHMRLHRGSRALSCCYCGKAFIHNKRLQSHEASCRPPGLPSNRLGPPSLSVQPKEEPLEEGEVRVEGGVIVGTEGAIDSKGRPGKKVRGLLARIQGDDAASAELLGGSENHFVKVVDGTVIYFCSVCERSYMTLSSLKRHSNVHSWRRKYPCHFCDKVFALAEYRTKHEVWHTGERRYQCIFCWDAFATYYNLKTHQKTIHGISPGLISSEKTANGGYKQKVNALKLYRLLPMRSQKRPYKTYSDGLPNGLLLPPGDPASLPLTLGLDHALGPEDLHGLINGAPSVKPDPDAFPGDFAISSGMEHNDLSTLTSLSQTNMSQVRKNDREAPGPEQGRNSIGFKMSSSSKTKTPKSMRGTETGVPSVITYGHTKPSVIVHGTAMSSSVIVHSNQVSSGKCKSPLNNPTPVVSDSQPPIKASPRSVKKQRESTESHRKRSRDISDTTGGGSQGRQESETGRSHHKSRKAHSKSDISTAKPLSAAGGSEVKGAGPLCQITVRIGEEAIVKRSISETDLRRDKSHSPPKAKRSEPTSPREAKEPRHSHHHHKHRAHRSTSQGAEVERKGGGGRGGGGGGGGLCEGEVRKKIPKSPDKVREYYFRQEVREQGDSDHDIEDNLWRPYYSYKPKRKAQAQLQRAKSWQRKLQYKRSLRLMRRAERLMNHVNKEAVKREDEDEDDKMEEEGEDEVEPEKEAVEEEEEEVEEAGEMSNVHTEREEEKRNELPPVSSKEKIKEANGQVEEAHRNPSTARLPSPKPPLPTSAPPLGIKRRPWTNGNAAECGTCGRWFSSPRKRDKHELSHLLEFVCLFCRATFPSRDKLEDHQRAQHPKPTESPSLPHKVDINEQGEGVDGTGVGTEITRQEEEREGRVGPLARSNSSPGCLSRRALARHTCPQCHKVCKTSSALTRHIRRHELSSSPERETEQIQSKPNAVEAIVSTVSDEPETKKEQVPAAKSVPVISYSMSDPQTSGSRLETEQSESRHSNLKVESQISEPYDHLELAKLKTPSPRREASPPFIKNPLDSPVNLTPTKLEIRSSMPTTPSTLQSVLVMSGSECLDYRTPRKRNLDSQSHSTPSPVCMMAPTSASPNTPMTSQPRINAGTPAIPMTTAPSKEVGFMKREGVIMDRDRQGGNVMYLHAGYQEPAVVQDLRVPSLSRSPSPNEAQDLTMSSILAREREMEKQKEMEREMERQRERERERQKARERERERGREREAEQAHQMAHPPQEEMTLLVPKEEPLSPTPSPQHVPTQTTINGPSTPCSHPKSPCRSPTAMTLLAQVNRQAHHPSQSLDRLPLPMGGSGTGDRPSAHALLLPRAPPPLPPQESEGNDTPSSRDSQHGEATSGGYPVQDFPLPLIVPEGYRSGKKQDDGLLMSSYPAGTLPFGPLGKVMVPNTGDLAKLPFYSDPYQLLYSPQLLAYPYNLAALPMALNMMAPGGDKVEPLPFLPALFNYAAAARPYLGAAPHPLVANPSLYSNSSGSSKKQRDSSGSKP